MILLFLPPMALLPQPIWGGPSGTYVLAPHLGPRLSVPAAPTNDLVGSQDSSSSFFLIRPHLLLSQNIGLPLPTAGPGILVTSQIAFWVFASEEVRVEPAVQSCCVCASNLHATVYCLPEHVHTM